ncbi:hypothetical protein [Gloeothece verrucosa]|uniref:Uncharacterized protein n=1 Tax=Gloeothece verrucosa (strain PCC 7822) TaxID=497965 RepID=E0UH60_GLOV7|nr:hypothetical protein [Gloeothece verrucosa]ADN15659.1 hypothetical protein Cyan7822_3723 [Gloeothece verrucosa PCC 7822]
MKKPFRFSNGKVAYSAERLIALCDQKENTKFARRHLKKGDFERWLHYMGEIDLCELANSSKDNLEKFLEDSYKILNEKYYIKYLPAFDKAIEIMLKEYETLRNEILQAFQERLQLNLLGLAAIFTLAGLGLAPLPNLLTTEITTVTEPGYLHSFFSHQFLYDSVNSSIGNTDLPSKQPIQSQKQTQDNTNDQEKLKIIRTTDSSTVPRAIIPCVIIFNWLIPIVALYMSYKNIKLFSKTIAIGEYIKNIIECRIKNIYEIFNIHDNSKYNILKQIKIPLTWERFVADNYNSTTSSYIRDQEILYVLLLLLVGISAVSFLGGTFLMNLEYTEQQYLNLPKFLYTFVKIAIFFIILLLISIFLNSLFVKKDQKPILTLLIFVIDVLVFLIFKLVTKESLTNVLLIYSPLTIIQFLVSEFFLKKENEWNGTKIREQISEQMKDTTNYIKDLWKDK